MEHVKENLSKNVNGQQNIKNQSIVKNQRGFLKNNTANMDENQEKNNMELHLDNAYIRIIIFYLMNKIII